MRRLMVEVGHAKTSKSSAGRVGLPGSQSVGGGTAVVSQGEGLRGVRLRISISRNRPYGNEAWQAEQAKRLGLMHTIRSEGRPKAVTL
jgi:hypothetical protein